MDQQNGPYLLTKLDDNVRTVSASQPFLPERFAFLLDKNGISKKMRPETPLILGDSGISNSELLNSNIQNAYQKQYSRSFPLPKQLGTSKSDGHRNGSDSNQNKRRSWRNATFANFKRSFGKPFRHADETSVAKLNLVQELSVGIPAALMLALHFRLDENGNNYVPVLLEQLRVEVTKLSDGDDQMYRITLYYGDGANGVTWFIVRDYRDFSMLHQSYKLSRHALRKSFKLPALPRLKILKPVSRQSETVLRDAYIEASNGRDILQYMGQDNFQENADPSDRYASFANELQIYLEILFRRFLFHPSNRLYRFLEISTLGLRMAAADGTYHGKEGYLLIHRLKSAHTSFFQRPLAWKTRHTPKWFIVRQSYILVVQNPESIVLYDIILFDTDFSINRQYSRDSSKSALKHYTFKIKNSEQELRLAWTNERMVSQFVQSINACQDVSPWTAKKRFHSFAPVRHNIVAQWLVDAVSRLFELYHLSNQQRDYYWNVSRAILRAKSVIYIHNWWLSPELFLRRPIYDLDSKWRLDRLLCQKASEGVKIYVIVYGNFGSTVSIDSAYTKQSLRSLHENIYVQRSPRHLKSKTFFWAHHEKIICIGFIGGIDLCFGRYDTPQHIISDIPSTDCIANTESRASSTLPIWPGKDYSNPRISDFYSLDKPFEDMYDRSKTPRLAWHDVSMEVLGQAAKDIARHFIQRWNFLLRQKPPKEHIPLLAPPVDYTQKHLQEHNIVGTCEFQLLRSTCPWSIGSLTKVETSILDAYCHIIRTSEHFVYIENQFFITSTDCEGTKIENGIGDALFERIVKADRNQERWRAVIILPLMPGFQNTVSESDGGSVRLIMWCQYRSICRGDSSLFGRLRKANIEPSDYINFYSLRTWTKLGKSKCIVTEMVYVHAKLIITDDRTVIIGSANINERSMCGNRDSEVSAIIRDTSPITIKMGGKKYKASNFAHTLRVRLMREHLGVDVDAIERKKLNLNNLDGNNDDITDEICPLVGNCRMSDQVTQGREKTAINSPDLFCVLTDLGNADEAKKETVFSTETISDSKNMKCNASDEGFQQGIKKIRRSLLAGEPIPYVDPDGFEDPLDESFLEDTWTAIARLNTFLYSRIFRCMPNDEVKTWEEYKAFATYSERFAYAQNATRGMSRTQEEYPGRSSPEGDCRFSRHVGTSRQEGSQVEKWTDESETEYGKNDAFNHNQFQNEQKHEDKTTTHSRISKPATNARKTNVSRFPKFELLEPSVVGQLLNEITGHLVMWPTEWLEREDKNGNFLTNMDLVPPLEIYN